MKRLVYPMLLITASLVIGAVFTTITAVAFASYSNDEHSSPAVAEEQLLDVTAEGITGSQASFSLVK